MRNQRTTGSVLGTSVEVSNIVETCGAVMDLAGEGRPAYICFATAHMLVEASREATINRAYRQAAMIAADGVPVAWCLRLKGHRLATCVSGPRTMPLLLEEASRRGMRVGFYGGRQETLDRMKQKLGTAVANLQIVYSCSPPFRDLTDDEQQLLLKGVIEARVQLLFVGLGSPKQERWMQEFSPSLNCVCLGVGAAFEFLSGEKILPPLWVQKLGMTWFVRLCQEPRRLARRNLASFVFVAKFAKEMVEEKLLRRQPSPAEDSDTLPAFSNPVAMPGRAMPGSTSAVASGGAQTLSSFDSPFAAQASVKTEALMLPAYGDEQPPLAEMPL